MKVHNKIFFALLFSLVLVSFSFADSLLTKPTLMLANVYDKNTNVKKYWVSEKYDGVRALWTGQRLISRQGNIFNAPQWFTENFPDAALDGELWLGRQNFAKVSGIVRTAEPIDTNWKQVKYMVFDLPEDKGIFTERYKAYKQLIKNLAIPWLHATPQWRVKNHDELVQHLRSMTDKGAEGLILHRADSYYHANRSNDLLKLKSHHDAEARVINHLPGKGLFEDIMGSMLVETNEGKRFKIGTGFTYEERLNPPAIGSIITYQYDGFTKTGLPRFARFLRIRESPK